MKFSRKRNRKFIARWFNAGRTVSLGTQLQVVDKVGKQTRALQQGRSYLSDGIDSYVAINNVTGFTFAGDFTISFNLFIPTATTSGGIMGNYIFGLDSWAIYYSIGGNVFLGRINPAGSYISSTTIPAANAPQNTPLHIVFSRSGSVIRAYVNGVYIAQNTDATTYTNPAATTFSLFKERGGALVSGVVGSIRLYNIAVWQVANHVNNNNFLPSTYFGGSRIYRNATMVFKCDEGNGTLCVNSGSLNNLADGTIINANLPTFHATDNTLPFSWQNKVGFTPTMRFNGGNTTSGIALGTSANANFQQHTAFTVHFRFVLDSIVGSNIFLGNWNAAGAGRFEILNNATNIQIFENASFLFNVNASLSAGVEYHLAVVRTSTAANDTRVYLNGALLGAAFTWANTTITTDIVRIGQDGQNAGALSLKGWLRNMIVSQSVIWSGAFTAPTTWDQYQRLEATNPSKYAIYNTLIIYNPFALPLTLVDTTNCQIPRNENDTANDAFGSPLLFSRSAKQNLLLTQANCLTFNGTSSEVALPNIALGSGDWSVEGYFNFANIATPQQSIYTWYNGVGAPMGIYKNSNGGNNQLAFYNKGNGGLDLGIVPVVGQWYKWRLQRVGTTVSCLINDVVMGTFLGDADSYTTSTTHSIGIYASPTFYFNGSQINLRITVAGTVVQDYSLQEGAGDRVFSRVGGHIGTMTNFNLVNAWATRQNVVHSNLVSGFDGSRFHNSDGYLSCTLPATIGTGDYTVDSWIYSENNAFESAISRNIFFLGGTDVSAAWDGLYIAPAGGLQFYNGTGGVATNNAFPLGTLNLNTWTHVAMQRNTNVVRIFINGTQVGANYTSNGNLLTPFLSGASHQLNIGRFQGYIKNTRVFNSAIFATGGFTAPTTEANYTSATNRLLFIRGITDFNNSLALTNVNTLLARNPITATNPQTQSNAQTAAGGILQYNDCESLTTLPITPDVYSANMNVAARNFFFTNATTSAAKTFANYVRDLSSVRALTSFVADGWRKLQIILKSN